MTFSLILLLNVSYHRLRRRRSRLHCLLLLLTRQAVYKDMLHFTFTSYSFIVVVVVFFVLCLHFNSLTLFTLSLGA